MCCGKHVQINTSSYTMILDSIKRKVILFMEEVIEGTGLSERRLVVVATGALSVTYLITKYWQSRKRASRYNLPPGPTPWPLFGNAIELSLSKENAAINFYRMSKDKYGPVIRLDILGMEFFVLNSFEVIQEAFGTKQDDFANRPVLWSGEMFSLGGKDIIFGQFGPTWKFHRQVVHQTIRKLATGQALETMVLRAFEQVADEIIKTEGVTSMREFVNLLTFSTSTSLCFNKEYGKDDQEFKQFMGNFEELMDKLGSGFPADFMPSLSYFPLCWPKMNAFKRFCNAFITHIKQELKEHRENYSAGSEPRDLIECLLEQKEKAEKEDPSKLNMLDEEHLIMTVFDVFIGGIDTVSHTLSWFLICMVKFPSIQEAVHEEIKEKWTSGVTLADLHNSLGYTQAVIHEVMRYETLSWLSIPVTTARDTTVGGYGIPNGSSVVINNWAMMMSEDYWENPKEFKPERFLNDEGEPRHHKAFMPFGCGRRRCVGEILGRNEFFMFVVLMIQRFKFTKPPSNEDFYSRANITIGNIPKEFHLIVTPRDD